MHCRRATTPGATYFFTVVTYQRQKLFQQHETIEYLRHAFRTVKATRPFTIETIVVLPDHLHCIWTLPPGDAAEENVTLIGGQKIFSLLNKELALSDEYR